MEAYPPPVDRLLTLGDVRDAAPHAEYVRTFGLGQEHVDDLIRMATDWSLHTSEDNLAAWAPVHAWRALGQLRAERAVEPILWFLNRLDQLADDWYQQELPVLFEMIGPPAIPALASYLVDSHNNCFPRVCALESLTHIVSKFPETRDEYVRAITEVLDHADQNDPTLNAFVIGTLVELEAADEEKIEQAFSEGLVDNFVCGDWPTVRARIRGEPEPERPLRRLLNMDEHDLGGWFFPPRYGLNYREETRRRRKREKTRRKRAAKSQKRNRKRNAAVRVKIGKRPTDATGP